MDIDKTRTDDNPYLVVKDNNNYLTQEEYDRFMREYRAMVDEIRNLRRDTQKLYEQSAALQVDAAIRIADKLVNRIMWHFLNEIAEHN